MTLMRVFKRLIILIKKVGVSYFNLIKMMQILFYKFYLEYGGVTLAFIINTYISYLYIISYIFHYIAAINESLRDSFTISVK